MQLRDLYEIKPMLASGLDQLLQFEGNVKEAFQTNFQINYESFGEMKSISLIPNGENIFVDNENRREYVDKYVQYIMEDSIQLQYEAFETGFKKVCGGYALDLFQPNEIELLVCGNKTLDFVQLKKGTKYEGFDANDKPIIEFWNIVSTFNEEEKKSFLKFCTGR